MSKEKIKNRLLSLRDDDDIRVGVNEENGTIEVIHKRHHALSFTFRWLQDHYVGYFIDGNGQESQAVIALWTSLDAINFASSYYLLTALRAKR